MCWRACSGEAGAALAALCTVVAQGYPCMLLQDGVRLPLHKPLLPCGRFLCGKASGGEGVLARMELHALVGAHSAALKD